MIEFRWAAVSDPGQLRAINQDSAFAGNGVFVVADGMGGHNGGEVASRWATLLLHQQLVSGPDSPDAAAKAAAVVLWTNSVIHAQAAEVTELSGMGTTVCALVVDPAGKNTRIVNVGDSRGYLQRDGELSQITEDHSLVETLVREGRLRAEDAVDHPQRNIVTRALGVDALVEVDEFVINPLVGDRYLLCSDGLSNELSDLEIQEVLSFGQTPAETVELMVDMANAAGGHDNITCVLVDVIDPAEDGQAAAEATEPVFVGSVLDKAGNVAPMPELPNIDPAMDGLKSGRATPRMLTSEATSEWGPTVKSFAGGAAGAAGAGVAVGAAGSRQASGSTRSSSGTSDSTANQTTRTSQATSPGTGRSERNAEGPVADDWTSEADGPGFSWRVPVFVVGVLVVLAVALGALLSSRTSTHYLGFDGEELVIFLDDGGLFPGGEDRVEGGDVTRSELEPGDVIAIEDREFEGTIEEMREKLVDLDPLEDTGSN